MHVFRSIKMKLLVLVLLAGIMMAIIIFNHQEVDDHLAMIDHPEQYLEVTNEVELLKYKPNLSEADIFPIFSLSSTFQPQVTARYLGFMEEIKYFSVDGMKNIDSNQTEPDLAIDAATDEYLIFQMYLEIETAQPIKENELRLLAKIRGDQTALNYIAAASTFFDNELDFGVQHGIVSFQISAALVDLEGEAVIVDTIIEWQDKRYSTEKISTSTMLAGG